MARKPKPPPKTLLSLVQEAGKGASGAALIALVEREIKISDESKFKAVFSSAVSSEEANQRRMKLGRLLYWLREGSTPLGATKDDLNLYTQIEALRSGNVIIRGAKNG